MSRILTSNVDPQGLDYERNEAEHRHLVRELNERLARAAAGGGEKARARHVDRGKLLPRDRVRKLLDPGTSFLEFSPLAALGLYDNEAPGAGLITGIGTVAGRDCVIVGNAATRQVGDRLVTPRGYPGR